MRLFHLPKKIGILLIRIYQKTLSPDHGMMAGLTPAGCRYYPTCSEYTAQAIDRFGLVGGSVLGSWRILRCNPFSSGGIDEVPDHFTFKKHSH